MTTEKFLSEIRAGITNPHSKVEMRTVLRVLEFLLEEINGNNLIDTKEPSVLKSHSFYLNICQGCHMSFRTLDNEKKDCQCGSPVWTYGITNLNEDIANVIPDGSYIMTKKQRDKLESSIRENERRRIKESL